MNIKKTVTSIFMVPTLRINREHLQENGFINAYGKDAHKDVQYTNSIYLLSRPKDLYKFKEFLDEEYARTQSIIDDYDYPDGYVVLVYQLNDKYKEDFEKVRRGEYSKTSKEFQSLFPEIVRINKDGYVREEVSLQVRIFKKDPYLKSYWEDKIDVELDEELEVWVIYDEEKETLNLDKFKENV